MALTEKQKKLAEQDKLIAERMERRLARRRKKLELKIKLGLIGKLFTFEDHIKLRDKKNINTIIETKGAYGRAGNRIYVLDKNGEFILDKKFKNSTKAKEFMKRL